MNLSEQQRDELFSLCLASVDEEFSNTDRARLESLVLELPPAADFYVHFVTLAAGLEWEFALDRGVHANEPRHVLESSESSDEQSAVNGQLSAFRKAESVERKTSVARRAQAASFFALWGHAKNRLLRRASRRPVPPSLAISVFVVGVGLMIMATVHVSEFVAKMHSGKSVDKSIDTPAKFEKLEKVAHLVKMTNAKWVIDRESMDDAQNARSLRNIEAGKAIHAGEKMYLASGLAEIKFDSGAEIVLQGPAEFEVQAGKKGRLEVGKLVGRCPDERSKGFVVETPTATIKDLGTEFGVDVSQTRAVHVHTFEGLVVVSDPVSGQAVEVKAEQYVDVQPTGKIGLAQVGGKLIGRFVRSLPRDTSVLIRITNSSFESHGGPDTGAAVAAPPWVFTGVAAGAVNFLDAQYTNATDTSITFGDLGPLGADGRHVATLNKASTATQDLGVTFELGKTYVFVAYFGTRKDVVASPDFIISLRNTLGDILATTTETSFTSTDLFVPRSVTYTETGDHVGETIRLFFQNTTTGGNQQISIDRVSLEILITPEPATTRAGQARSSRATRHANEARKTVEAFGNEPEESLAPPLPISEHAPANPPSQKPLPHTDTTRKEQL